jgi:hypothetical protein
VLSLPRVSFHCKFTYLLLSTSWNKIICFFFHFLLHFNIKNEKHKSRREENFQSSRCAIASRMAFNKASKKNCIFFFINSIIRIQWAPLLESTIVVSSTVFISHSSLFAFVIEHNTKILLVRVNKKNSLLPSEKGGKVYSEHLQQITMKFDYSHIQNNIPRTMDEWK